MMLNFELRPYVPTAEVLTLQLTSQEEKLLQEDENLQIWHLHLLCVDQRLVYGSQGLGFVCVS